MEKLNPQHFTWSRWRSGSPATFFIKCRELPLIRASSTLRKHTVGWCNSSSLLCRPKRNNKAVMFFYKGRHFWFHLTDKEFEVIYERNFL
jgi:hypothetical protein